jgi:hypothetical protein
MVTNINQLETVSDFSSTLPLFTYDSSSVVDRSYSTGFVYYNAISSCDNRLWHEMSRNNNSDTKPFGALDAQASHGCRNTIQFMLTELYCFYVIIVTQRLIKTEKTFDNNIAKIIEL